MILVTGSNGFVGQALCKELSNRGMKFKRAVREFKPSFNIDNNILSVELGDIGPFTDWSNALTGVDTIIHLAGRVHIMHENKNNVLSAYRLVNVDGTRRLAEQAAAKGVRRLIYLSSIKVNGESTDGLANPFGSLEIQRNSNIQKPVDPYAISKWEAERVLQNISTNTDLEVVNIRPPLVYGPGVRGNLARLLKLLKLGIPLPLGAIHNKRSLIGLGNLVDLIICCVSHVAAPGQTLLVSDGKDISTPDLLKLIAAEMGRSARLLPVPVPLLQLTGNFFGKREEINRLVGSLQIDNSHVRETLNWYPPVTFNNGIRQMVKGA